MQSSLDWTAAERATLMPVEMGSKTNPTAISDTARLERNTFEGKCRDGVFQIENRSAKFESVANMELRVSTTTLAIAASRGRSSSLGWTIQQQLDHEDARSICAQFRFYALSTRASTCILATKRPGESKFRAGDAAGWSPFFRWLAVGWALFLRCCLPLGFCFPGDSRPNVINRRPIRGQDRKLESWWRSLECWINYGFTSLIRRMITIFTRLTLSLPSSQSTFSQLLKRKCISEVVRIDSVIIFHLCKRWKAKFFILCGVTFMGGCRRNLKLITLGSERVHRRPRISAPPMMWCLFE